MSFLNRLKMQPKLILLFLLVGLVPLIVATGLGIMQSRQALQAQAFEQLDAVKTIKRHQLEDYFAERQSDITVLANTARALQEAGFDTLHATQNNKAERVVGYFEGLRNDLLVLKDAPDTLEAMLAFDQAFEDAGRRVNTAAWQAVAAQYDARFQNAVTLNGWRDLYLIDQDGDVVYSVQRTHALGRAILDSELQATSLGAAFQQAQTMGAEDLAVVDFAPYVDGETAGFMMAQLRDITGTLQGYLAFRIPTDQLNAIMQDRSGLGTTGESYLMGQHNGVVTYRNARVVKPGVFGGERAGDDEYIQEALAGITDLATKVGATGDLELTAYAPLNIPGLHWAIYTTQALEEIIVPTLTGSDRDYFTYYIDEYGYYDLFLIDPDGFIFYSVRRESDYETNILTGPYRTSNLGALVRQVMESRRYGIADFAPYEPSGGDQAAFIALPILDNFGAVELLVALQLPNDQINAMMHERTGMGDSGEVYLVGKGADGVQSFRNDILTINPGVYVIGHPISVDYIDAAMAGQSASAADRVISTDSIGNQVFVVYDQLDIPGLHWVILSKVDVDEVMQPANSLALILGAVAVSAALVVVAIAYFFARSLAQPIDLLTQGAQRLAVGDATLAGMDTRAIANINARGDELGDIGNAFSNLIAYFKRGATTMQSIARGDLSVDIQPEGETDLMGHAMVEMKASLNEMTAAVTMLVDAAVAGQLDTRADPTRFEGEYRRIVQGINETLNAVIGPLNVAAEYVDRISKGDIPEKITDQYRGDFNEIKLNLNLCIDALNGLIVEAGMLTDAAVAGRLETRGDAGKFHGAYADIVLGLNATLDAVIDPLNDAANYVDQMARGEIPAAITKQYQGDFDTLKNNLNSLSASLRAMLGNMQEAANNLASASAEILAATTQQASGASEQSAAITQTTTTVDEVKTISEQAIVRAQEVADSSQRTVQVSRAGRHSVEETINSMAQIKERVEGIAENIIALSEQTQQIGEITAAVNDIASQSNMLALNASVEAARAGEHGKGFAVVAVEVRNLAEQSKQATAQVRAILTDIQNAINASVMVTEEGAKVVDEGVGRAAEAREAIEQLSSVIAESAQIAAQVVAGGQQQASGVEQIALAMQNINQAMVQSMASTRQAEKSAKDLNALAVTLTETVKTYKVNGGNGQQ